MKRSLLTLSGLAAVLILVGCASESTAPAPVAASAPVAATAPAAPAPSDAAIAEKFKGVWTGEWIFVGYGSGKFIFNGISVEGNTLKGEAQLFGTATGDVKVALTSAVVEKGVLKAEGPDLKFTLKMKSDTESAGEWFVKGYNGDLKVRR